MQVKLLFMAYFFLFMVVKFVEVILLGFLQNKFCIPIS